MKRRLSFSLLCLFLTASLIEAQIPSALRQLAQPARQPASPVQQGHTGDASGKFAVMDSGSGMNSGGVALGNISIAKSNIVPADAELTHKQTHVLLIGVAQYQMAETNTENLISVNFGNLTFSVKDMEGLKDALVKSRFCREEDIQFLATGAEEDRKPTARNVETVLRGMLEKIEKGDRVLIAFSGHGIALPEGERTVDFLCLADAKVTYDREAGRFIKDGLIRRSGLEEMLDVSEAEIKLFFIDACRNVLDVSSVAKDGNDAIAQNEHNDPDGRSRGLGSIKGVDTFGNGVPSQIENPGFFRFSSCGPGEVSWEFSSKGHGIFTYFLINGMLGEADRGRGVVTLSDLQAYVSTETTKFVRENNMSPTQAPVSVRFPEESRITEAHILFSYPPGEGGKGWRLGQNEQAKQAALTEIDEEIWSLTQQTSIQSMTQILQARQILNISFSQQGYQYVMMLIADMHMRIGYAIAEREWIAKNPPPANRNRLRVAGAIAGQFVPYGGYINMGTQLAASSLEQRDRAAYARRVAVMREQLAVYVAETGTPGNFMRDQEERRLDNQAVLDDLESQLRPYQGKLGHANLVNEIRNSRARSRSVDVTDQVTDLEQRTADFIAEQEQRLAEQQERRLANQAALDELEQLLTQHQNQSQTYRNLLNNLKNLQISNDRGTDVSAQITTLEQRIESFITEPDQRPTPSTQQQQQRRRR